MTEQFSKIDVSSHEIPALDGLRGLLALWVVLGHASIYCGVNIAVLNSPGLAVVGFMMLSGFLMAFHYRIREAKEPWESPYTWLKFFMRRFFRLAPLYYFLLAISISLNDFFSFAEVKSLAALNPNVEYNDAKVIGLKSILLHISFLFSAFPSEANNNSLPDWSLGLEMQFYAAFPFLMLAYRRIGALLFGLLCLAVYAAAQHCCSAPYVFPSILPLTITMFAVGMVISESYLSTDIVSKSYLLIVALLILTLLMPPALRLTAFVIVISVNLGTMAPLIAGSFGSRLVRLAGGRTLRTLGDLSYSIYLLHPLILYPLLYCLTRIPIFVAMSPLSRFAILAPILAVLCYATAFFTYRFIEIPFIAFGRTLISGEKLNKLPAE
jgi:peptidoglycan/LPS O-acetylase OafA/YrhL